MSKNRWKNEDALITAFDGYEDILQNVILQRSKYLKRAEAKPMAKVKDPGESHLSTRGMHMLQAASEGKKIARRLGLNETVVYIGMMMHDSGHTFGGHEGEQTMNIIGELLKSGYFHHNAKGIDVILGEDLIGKFIEDIPGAKEDSNLREKLENDVWYFLDIVVGHDGESTNKDNKENSRTSKKYGSIKEAVLDKTSTANRKNIYKCQAETLETQISKPTDVISYIKTDTLDGFSQGIIKKISDDYLELIGELLCESNEKTEEIKANIEAQTSEAQKEVLRKQIRQQRISDALKLIDGIKKEELNETRQESFAAYEEEMVKVVDGILEHAQENGINIYNLNENDKEKLNQVASIAMERYKLSRQAKGVDKNTIASEVNKISDYTQKMIKTRKRVVEKVMKMVQEGLENDYVETTLQRWGEIEKDKGLTPEERYEKKKQAMGFSDKVTGILYGTKDRIGLKQINYLDNVQYTKKEYQTKSLPKAVFKLVQQCSEALVKTGVIRDKFYDRGVLNSIRSEEVKKAMKVPERDERVYDKYKEGIGIEQPGKIIRPRILKRNSRFINKLKRKSVHRKKLYRDIFRFTQRQEQRFANSCEDVYYAIPYTVRSLIKKALDDNYDGNSYLPEEEKRELIRVKKELSQRFGRRTDISKEELEEYINEKVEVERANLEKKVANEIAIKYIAGMTDTGITDILIKTGNLSKRKLAKENKLNKNGNKNVRKLSEALSREEK